MSTSVARAARAEKKAEGDRKAADAAWRAAWWKTTMELAGVPGSPRTELTQAYHEVEAVLGQGTSWLSKRRKTGTAFVVLEHNEIQDLPPRKAMVVMESGVKVTAEIVAMLRESERTEETLREFSARLTGTPWSIGSDEEIEKALEAKPELARKIATETIKTDQTAAAAARQALGEPSTEEATAERIVRDPGFAARLAADDDARLAMAKAVSESEVHQQIRRDQTRHANEEQAREAETVYHLAGARVLAVGWEATNLAEFIETKVLRTDEDIAAARNAGQWLQAIGRRIVAWADGLTVPLSDEDFAREIQTILQGGERA